jgi:hypothetical protein
MNALQDPLEIEHLLVRRGSKQLLELGRPPYLVAYHVDLEAPQLRSLCRAPGLIRELVAFVVGAAFPGEPHPARRRESEGGTAP